MTSTSEISSFRMTPPPAAFYAQEADISQSNYAALLKTLCIEWKPAELVEELSNIPLEELVRRGEESYVKFLPGREAFVRRCFGPLRSNMNKALESLLTDAKNRELYHNLLNQKAGETVLRDYFTENPEENISHWVLSVRRRALRDAVKEGLA